MGQCLHTTPSRTIASEAERPGWAAGAGGPLEPAVGPL